MIFSKLAEVDNENDDFNVNHNFRNDGLDSNGSSFASSEEGRRNGAPMNGAINWDYFTDWGPSFEKLVGVFKDIASLPDGDETTNSNMDCRTETEEYV
jgi:protocadherin Fat 4